MKLAVIGSRGFNNYEVLKNLLDELDIDEIVSGGALGADALAKRYAVENDIKIIELIPDWDRFGKRAGFKRNEDIWKYCTSGIAFWDGKSKGTKHSFALSEQAGKTLLVYEYKDNEKSDADEIMYLATNYGKRK